MYRNSLVLLVIAYALACVNQRPVNADYNYTYHLEMIRGADLIASGEVVELHKNTYTFQLREILVGKSDTPTVEVDRFCDWTCAWRYHPYQVGDTFLLFAMHKNDSWQVIGSGCEGEIPLVGDDLYVLGVELKNFPTTRFENHRCTKCTYDELRAEILTRRRSKPIVFAANAGGNKLFVRRYPGGRTLPLASERQPQPVARETFVQKLLGIDEKALARDAEQGITKRPSHPAKDEQSRWFPAAIDSKGAR